MPACQSVPRRIRVASQRFRRLSMRRFPSCVGVVELDAPRPPVRIRRHGTPARKNLQWFPTASELVAASAADKDIDTWSRHGHGAW